MKLSQEWLSWKKRRLRKFWLGVGICSSGLALIFTVRVLELLPPWFIWIAWPMGPVGLAIILSIPSLPDPNEPEAYEKTDE